MDKFNQEIDILPSKCGKWKLGGKKLWKLVKNCGNS